QRTTIRAGLHRPVVVVWNGRGIEAHTGVPAAVCAQLASHAGKWRWMDTALLVVLLAGTMAFNQFFWWRFVGQVMMDVFGRGEGPIWLGQLLCIVPPVLIVGLVWVVIYNMRFWRMLDRFRDEPWCLKCRYPVPLAGLPGDA